MFCAEKTNYTNCNFITVQSIIKLYNGKYLFNRYIVYTNAIDILAIAYIYNCI